MLTKYTRLLARIFGLLVLVMMSACHRSQYLSEEDLPKLPCKVQGACDATQIKYLRYFGKRGVKVVTIGQNYLISIPAHQLFEDQSPHLMWASYGLLNDVATFLKQFRIVAMNITSYSSRYVSVQREKALTLARSRVVSEYLWSQGVDSRLIFTEGLGSDKPIVSRTQNTDESANARVEITFRQAIE